MWAAFTWATVRRRITSSDSNTSGTDFGVNYVIDPTQPGFAVLRGFAYGANIGWINFESTGNPRLRFSHGNFEGHVWSANNGWINLGNGAFGLNTLSVTPGVDRPRG